MFGKYIGASSLPFDQYTKKDGERLGHHWLIPSVKSKRAIRHVMIDTNYWKTFLQARLRTAMGDKGCLSLWGHRPADHRMLADHWASEYGVKTEGRGRSVVEWKLPPGKPRNHYLDCIVGAMVGASMLGVTL